jgi:hypothetical protein
LSCLFGQLENHFGGRRFADGEEVETERKWLRQQSKDFCAAGFDALLRRVGTSVSVLVEDMLRNKWSFHVRISHVLHPFVTYLLSLPHASNAISLPGF